MGGAGRRGDTYSHRLRGKGDYFRQFLMAPHYSWEGRKRGSGFNVLSRRRGLEVIASGKTGGLVTGAKGRGGPFVFFTRRKREKEKPSFPRDRKGWGGGAGSEDFEERRLPFSFFSKKIRLERGAARPAAARGGKTRRGGKIPCNDRP